MGKVMRVAEEADKEPLGRQVGVDDRGGEESGQGEAVRDALEEDAGGAERGRRDVLSGVAVDL